MRVQGAHLFRIWMLKTALYLRLMRVVSRHLFLRRFSRGGGRKRFI